MIRIGGPIFVESQNPAVLANEHRRLGYRAAYCPAAELSDSLRIREIRDAFATADVVIAEAGAWCNLLAVDPAKRAANFNHVCKRLTLADEMGALCCVDYLGTLDPGSDYGPHPQNLTDDTFAMGVEIIRKLIDTVRPKRTKFALEMMQWVIPDSVEIYKKLIQAVDRPGFAVHLDPVNIIVSPRDYFATGHLIRHCFEELGQWVVSCHAKDLRLRNELALHFDEVRPGLGMMDYGEYLLQIQKLDGRAPLMLEHLNTAEEYAAAREFLGEVCRIEELEV